MARKNKDIPVLILAGGLGTRLKRALPNLPKSLALINGRPFLSYLLNQVEPAGFRKVILCTGYRGELIRDQFGDSYGKLSLTYSHEKKPLGTAGAIRLALPLIKSDLFVVMNGDSYIDIDFDQFLQSHLLEGSMVLKWQKNASRYGSIVLDVYGNIKSFREKATPKESWVNAGVYIFSTSLLKFLRRGKK